jgi:hypothetical protein
MFKMLAFCPSPHARTPPPIHRKRRSRISQRRLIAFLRQITPVA